MKKHIAIILLFLFGSICVFAQTDVSSGIDYSKTTKNRNRDHKSISEQLVKLIDVAKVQSIEIEKLKQRDASLSKRIVMIEQSNHEQSESIKSLKIISLETESLVAHEKKHDVIATEAQFSDHNRIDDAVLLWIMLMAFGVVLSIILAVFLHRKGRKDIVRLKGQVDSLNINAIEGLSKNVEAMQKLTLSSAGGIAATHRPENDHSLVKVLADRITFMEMTLCKMDTSIRGHKQLSKSIKQMKDNLLANGYELVDMLGKPYHEGMKVLPNFVEDDTIERGKQIITGIVKPQINYNGVMIQSAQITVSQN